MVDCPPILVVLVHYRTPREAERCLHSLAAERQSMPGLQAVLWDNASGDGSWESLTALVEAQGWGDWLQLEASQENLGFGAGNNAVVRPRVEAGTCPEHVLLLNPDTVVRKGALKEMLRFQLAEESADFVGPASFSGGAEADVTAFRFPGIISHLVDGLRFGFIDRLFARYRVAPAVRKESHRTDWVSGGCVLIRRRVFERVGYFDEGFFLYFEETDLSRRACAHGLFSWYHPAAEIEHYAGAATGLGRAEGPPPRTPGYWFASRQLYFRKHFGVVTTYLADWGFVLGRLLWLGVARLAGKRRADPPAFLRDFAAWSLFGRRWVGVRKDS